MESVYYYIYCEGILGVKTNSINFKWIYGSSATEASKDDYDKCAVKFDIFITPEKSLKPINKNSQRFQSYTWDNQIKKLSCRRKLFKYINIGYDIEIKGNTVQATIGKNYYKYVQNRFMNLHGIYYLLSDLANILLLQNGFASLYASAVHNDLYSRCVVNFAPPNTGKTLTVVKLCELGNYSMIGEDVVISDGKKVFSCPWTCSYRGNEQEGDTAGALNRVENKGNYIFKNESLISDCIVLSLGDYSITQCKEIVLKKALTLTEYLFNGYASPIVSILRYFDDSFDKPWDDYAHNILGNIVENSNAYLIQSSNSKDFYIVIDKLLKENNDEGISNI